MAVNFEELQGRISIQGEEQATSALLRVQHGFQGAGEAAGGMAHRLRVDVRGGYESLITTVSNALNIVERLQRAISAPFQTAVQFDSLTRGMEAVTGSSAAAQEQLKRLEVVSRLPGLSFADAIEGSIRLQSAGLSAQLAERSLKAFGNALATVGKGSAELSGVNLALSQIVSKGVVSAEEINQLAERIPSIRKAMQEAFGTADTEAIQKMGLSAEVFIERLVTQFERMPQVTGGVQNALENIAQSIQKTFEPLGRAAFPIVEAFGNILPPILEKTQGLFEGIAAAVKGMAADGTLKRWADGIASAFENVGRIAALAGGAMAAMVTSTIVTGAIRVAMGIGEIVKAMRAAGVAAFVLQGLALNLPAILGGIAGAIAGIVTFNKLDAALAGTGKSPDLPAAVAAAAPMQAATAIDRATGTANRTGTATARGGSNPLIAMVEAVAAQTIRQAQTHGGRQGAGTLEKIAENTAKTARALEASLSLRRQVFGGGRQAALGVTAQELGSPAGFQERRRPSRVVVNVAGQNDLARGVRKIAQNVLAKDAGYGFNPRW